MTPPTSLLELQTAIRMYRPQLADGLGPMTLPQAFRTIHDRLGWPRPPSDTLLSDSARKIIDEITPKDPIAAESKSL